jgi:hypothetical protein
MAVTGMSVPGRVDSIVSAQALNPCALLTVDEIEALASKTSGADGIATSAPEFGHVGCRYMWGAGVNRFTLDITVNEASRMFRGMTTEQIKQKLVESVRAGTGDEVIAEIGEAAVFRPDSPVYAGATALVKGRILAVHLDGIFAAEKKDQVIGLLKSAASRL